VSVSEQQQVTLLTNADVGDSELCWHVFLMQLELEFGWMAWSSLLPMTMTFARSADLALVAMPQDRLPRTYTPK